MCIYLFLKVWKATVETVITISSDIAFRTPFWLKLCLRNFSVCFVFTPLVTSPS